MLKGVSFGSRRMLHGISTIVLPRHEEQDGWDYDCLILGPGVYCGDVDKLRGIG